MKNLKSILLFLFVFAISLSNINGQSIADSLHLPEIVVTASSTREIIPSQKLTGEELKNLNSLSVADAVRYFSGVQIKDYGGIGGLKTVDIRSMGTNHMGVFYDGIQLGNAQNGQIDLGKYSLDSFIWDGYAAIEDPVRTNVPDAIRVARNAGIKVKIVTGDNPETACSIAKDANISNKPNYMLGGDIARQTMFNLTKTDVFARTRPEDKQELVKKFQQIGEVVASVGDGSNDSAALNQAEVGIAMNNSTDIAKDIQHFIMFQLTVNVVAILIACVGPFIGVDLPFTVTQMLLVNLIMDTFAALQLMML